MSRTVTQCKLEQDILQLSNSVREDERLLAVLSCEINRLRMLLIRLRGLPMTINGAPVDGCLELTLNDSLGKYEQLKRASDRSKCRLEVCKKLLRTLH